MTKIKLLKSFMRKRLGFILITKICSKPIKSVHSGRGHDLGGGDDISENQAFLA
jgi:hypothetical protein